MNFVYWLQITLSCNNFIFVIGLLWPGLHTNFTHLRSKYDPFLCIFHKFNVEIFFAQYLNYEIYNNL